jgi:hypothetical protein
VEKSGTGWFSGFKIHLIINDFGDPVRMKITPANVADTQQDLLKRMLTRNRVSDKG